MLTQKDLLVLLYKLADRYIFTQGDRYEYNYDYLSPLAMTDVPEIPLIKFPRFPKDELPSREWILLLLKSISVVSLNRISKAIRSNISFSTDGSDIDDPYLSDKIDSLEQIEQEFSTTEKPEDLNDITSAILSTLKEVNEYLYVDEQLNEYCQSGNDIAFSLEEEFQSIDSKLAELANDESGDISFDVDYGELDSLENLKDIIRYNAKLLELADIKSTEELADSSDVSFSSVDGETSTLEDYDNLFRVIRKPEISTNFQNDLVFAYMQVAGPNPVMLKQIQTADPRLPITEQQYGQIIANITESYDSLQNALEEGRLYIADYSLLADMENGNFPKYQKYIAAPVALFAVPPYSSGSRSLIPIAIKIEDALFTPLEEGTWMTAKNIVQMADSNYHELVSHLGQTHLFIEPFVVATNHLAPNHVLRKLLKPHLDGTVLINYGAHRFLVAPEGSVDKLLASTIESDQKLAVKGAQNHLLNFNEVAFPKTLASRGVNNSEQLPIYPYRDDGMLIWNAIYNWVHDYLSAYYTDSTISTDKDLQFWGRKLTSISGGRLQNFGQDDKGGIHTVDYLVEAVSTIIFTASAQHAAVNFAQRGLMMYPPAFPLARYTPAPTNPQECEDFINGLPPLDLAADQISLLYLLGSVYYTKLGDYTKSDFSHNPRVEAALANFQNELKYIEEEIRERNQNSERLLAYEYLLPSKIPQSINI